MKIAIADEGRDGVGSECGNVRTAHGCLRMRLVVAGVTSTSKRSEHHTPASRNT